MSTNVPAAIQKSATSTAISSTPSRPDLKPLDDLIASTSASVAEFSSERATLMADLDDTKLHDSDADKEVQRRRDLTIQCRGLHQLCADGIATIAEAREKRERIIRGEPEPERGEDGKLVDDPYARKPEKEEKEGDIGDVDMDMEETKEVKHNGGDKAEDKFYEMLEA